jgi:small-conductance mechanosensitive channel
MIALFYEVCRHNGLGVFSYRLDRPCDNRRRLFLDILRPSGGLMIALQQYKTPVPLVSLRGLWLTLATLIPSFLVLLVLLSYVYTAAALFVCILQTIGLMLIIVLGHQMGMRWLQVTTRRLKYQSLRKKRKIRMQLSKDSQTVHEDSTIHYDLPGIDLTELSRDSIKLLNSVIAVSGMLGLLLVWYPILPALSYLENVQLWSVTTTVQGAELIDAITLAELLYCILIVGFSYALYQNLPALLKLFFIQGLNLTASAHYTAINLILYVIVVASFFRSLIS